MKITHTVANWQLALVSRGKRMKQDLEIHINKSRTNWELHHYQLLPRPLWWLNVVWNNLFNGRGEPSFPLYVSPLCVELKDIPCSFVAVSDIHPDTAPFLGQSMKQHPLEIKEERNCTQADQELARLQAKASRRAVSLPITCFSLLCMTISFLPFSNSISCLFLLIYLLTVSTISFYYFFCVARDQTPDLAHARCEPWVTPPALYCYY
jgi:hypothetical protein